MDITYPIEKDYFEWLCRIVCRDRFAKDISYERLLAYLHETDFVYSIRKDSNRAADGIDLRCRFANCDGDRYLRGACSVLEMMVALAIRCEETIMDDTEKGNRTGQWFWGMVTNLGLGSMSDDRFDKEYVVKTIHKFLYHEYEPDGKGGLFLVKNCPYDLREIEIWTQLCWYLDSIT